MPSTCPRCQTSVPLRHSFCPACHLLVLLPSRERGQYAPAETILAGARVSADAVTSEILDRLPVLPVAAELLTRYWNKPLERAKYLGNGIRVGPEQFPDLYASVQRHAEKIEVPCPEVFLSSTDPMNACTFGTISDACVIVGSRLYELLDEQELSFILGHELGHIKARHVTYSSVLSALTHGILGFVPGTNLLLAPLQAWQREAELTADRIGFLLTEDPVAAIRAIVLLTLGSRSLMSRMTIGPYLAQNAELCSIPARIEEYFGGHDHPFLVTRVVKILQFAQTDTARKTRRLLHPDRAVPNCGVWPEISARHSALPLPSFCSNCGFEVHASERTCSVCGMEIKDQ